MSKILIVLICLTLVAAAFGVAQAQDERTALADGFYVGLLPGQSMDYHIPKTIIDGRVYHVNAPADVCAVLIYYRDGGGWHFYDQWTMPRGQTIIETSVYPGMYCNPGGYTLDLYSNTKIRVYSVHIPTVKTSRNPYNLPTPYP